MQIVCLESTSSTNSFVAQNASELPSPCLVYTNDQTAGRGQRGNSWESEPGKNITASLLVTPQNFEAKNQFHISEAIALAIVEFLDKLRIIATIKWPNDIYVGKRKICGILVEHVVVGRNISRTVAGFGININQTEFHSDAPNPVSVAMITGKTFDIELLIEKLAEILEKYVARFNQHTELHRNFLSSLWRKDDAFHGFRDAKTDEIFQARISDVEPSGLLVLETEDGNARKYSFKEVEFIV